MKILIVHPEGNITNNPHLLGVLGLFVERRIAVDVLIPNRPDIEAGPLFPGCTVLKAPVPPRAYLDHTLLLRGAGPEDIDHRVASFCEWRNDYEFIVGIDRGIIEAAMIANRLSQPLGLISYEIFFADECGEEFKQPERAACRDVRFVVSQDEVRASHVCAENGIPADRVILMPVAGLGERTTYGDTLPRALGLPGGTRVLLCMGELNGEWSGTRQLVESAHLMPERWVLVLHHRYGSRVVNDDVRELVSGRERVLFSPFESLPARDLPTLLGGVNLGAALYYPTFGDVASGKNTQLVGLSSGKFATLLQHRVPVLVNGTGPMASLVRKYEAGVVLDDHEDLGSALRAFELLDETGVRDNARRLFTKELDLARTSTELLAALNV